MRFAINVPNFGDYGDARVLAQIAREAEDAGWDGFFLWDHLQYFDPSQRVPVADPWIALSAIATVTRSIRLGPMITPIARRRPWKLARETVSLDHLSGGRLTLGVGLGGPPESDFAAFGEEVDPRVRAEMLDEGLAVLTGLWRGEPFSHQGEHYQIRDALFLPPPLQQPRIPIWVGGFWPHRAPFRRAAHWDGVFPADAATSGQRTLTPDEIGQVTRYIARHRTTAEPFDVVITGETPGDEPTRAVDIVAPYAAVGCTWWLEPLHGFRGPLDAMRDRIRQGPPQS
jgi:alkanesulfonate monooxygenase SsuD/methylene tetrahydromethanopterin reductase-like flavin-dependent oxidoreductase (luciferase family)